MRRFIQTRVERRRGGPIRRAVVTACTAAVVLSAVFGPPAAARVFKTFAQAMAGAFPQARIERKTVFVTAEQRARIEAAAGHALPAEILHPYEVFVEDRRVAVVYVDVHRVRTKTQALMLAVDVDGRIRHLEMLASQESSEYHAPAKWYAAFVGRMLSDDLQPGRGVDAITGATATVRSTTQCARRVLALHRELYPPPAPTSSTPR